LTKFSLPQHYLYLYLFHPHLKLHSVYLHLFLNSICSLDSYVRHVQEIVVKGLFGQLKNIFVSHISFCHISPVNQNVVNLPTNNHSRLDVCKWVEHLRSRSGVEIVRLRKPWHTDTPSIQGVWTPFTTINTSLAAARFPDPARYAVRSAESATQRLARLSTERVKIGAGLSRGAMKKLWTESNPPTGGQ